MILKSQSYSYNLEEYIRSNSLDLALGLLVLIILFQKGEFYLINFLLLQKTLIFNNTMVQNSQDFIIVSH